MKPIYLIVILHLYAFLSILFIPGVYAAESDIRFTIANDLQINSKQFEFDLLLYDPDASQLFEESTVQAGIYFNTGIINGGTISAIIIPGTSQLNPSQIPTSITVTQSQGIIKIASKAPPGCGAGTIISTNPDLRTRVCRIRVTNTADFTSCSTANLIFCFTTTPYPTKISYYKQSDCIHTACTVNLGNCYSMASNQPFNYGMVSPSAFMVTGGGLYCGGGCGLPVGLNGSEVGVVYTLFKDGVTVILVLAGTGSALTFGCMPQGTYTAIGQRTACGGGSYLTTQMIGSAVISIYVPTVGGIVNGPDSAVEGVTLINLTLSDQTGNVLKWQKRLNAGNWIDIPNTSALFSEVATSTGTWEYRAVVQNGTCLIENSTPWSVIVTNRTLKVKLFLQGLYNLNTGLMDKAQDENGDHFPGDTADLVTVSLAHNTFPYNIDYTINNLALPRNGIITTDLPAGSSSSYYIIINHRNSIETWSASPVNMSNIQTLYNFTNGYYKAYGNNLLPMGSAWVIYGADVNQDGIVDASEMITTENLASQFATGYLPEDNNGDGLVDSSDMSMIGNNSALFVSKITP
jgi:hypothetical protein